MEETPKPPEQQIVKRGRGRPRNAERKEQMKQMLKWNDSMFDGSCVTFKGNEEIRDAVHRKALECLPHALRLAMYCASEAERVDDKLKALKFIKELADGNITAKEIKVAAKQWTDDELLSVLDNEAADDGE